MPAQDTAVAVAFATARRFTGRTIVYHRADESVTLSAIKGKSDVQVIDKEMILGVVQTVDWIFEKSELTTLTPAEPKPGDWVEYEAVRYDLVRAAPTDCWRHADPGNTWVRVHTTRLGAVT